MDKQIIERVTNYFNENPGVFTDWDITYILRYLNGKGNINYSMELVREVLDELNLIPDEQNIYLGFRDLLDSEFHIKDKNIVEVGGGTLPRLAKRIREIQGLGKITVYDPKLSVLEKSTDNLILKKEKITERTVLPKDVDLITALMPCGAAHNIITVAGRYDLDFMIGLCEGGPHGEPFDYFEDDEEWLSSVMHTAKYTIKENNMGELGIQYLKKYGDPYPVIYNKRTK